ncbi:Uma2 family endonuclease [Argonema galeatum]|uniref:Uma2 family endonuclease n=1 Tax=Argonema galeatum TaxID=2942762 RepID=UPI002011A561|nr:Uma2 family endonuclease [Argonema galeatum]MCL1468707.1 Uma2 family endonuclease [Argonema galeatum A003/A1]
MVTLQLRQLGVPPGHRVLFHDVNWQEFEAILEELGEKRPSRLAYINGTLEIRVPLPEHEKAKVIIGDLVKALLDECDRNWESLGSTTFKREDMLAGIEPDNCFYIQNHAQMIGKTRLDLTVDPPPDLAIEVDVTSKTQVSAYQALGVPEIWRYENGKIQIYLLQSGKYVELQTSPTFPSFPIIEEISRFLEMSRTIGTSRALREFRKWVRKQRNLIN